jgi:glycosyltransferase involved in cell wall biosynthesis
MQPSVSIIVPAYNHAAFLKRRFDTIFCQSFKDWELIILDDASSDGSQLLLKEYASHPQVSQLVLNEKNSGNPFVQWHRGIELAKSPLIWIAESDDEASPDFLKTCVSAFNQDPACVIAYCRSTIVDETGNILPNHAYWPDGLDNARWKSDFVVDGKTEIINSLRFRNTIPNASAVVFARSQAANIQIPANLRFVGDWYFWSELAQTGSIHFFAEELSQFRFHAQTTRSTKSKRTEEMRVNEYLWMIHRLTQRFIRGSTDTSHSHDWMAYAWCYQRLGIPWCMFKPNLRIPLSVRMGYFWGVVTKMMQRDADRVKRFLDRPKRRLRALFPKSVPPMND